MVGIAIHKSARNRLALVQNVLSGGQQIAQAIGGLWNLLKNVSAPQCKIIRKRWRPSRIAHPDKKLNGLAYSNPFMVADALSECHPLLETQQIVGVIAH